MDTSVLVAGVAGLKDQSVPVTPSAQFLYDWIENDTFTWLVTVAAEPDPRDAPFWTCADLGAADFIVTLNTKDFPQRRLSAKVIGPHEPLPSHRFRRRIARSRRAR